MNHCYTITYCAKGEAGKMVGSGYGSTPEEAMKDFYAWHEGEVEKVLGIEFYK